MFDAQRARAWRPAASASTLTIPERRRPSASAKSAFYVATPHIDADGLPDDDDRRSARRRQRQDPGWIVAEISLEELWRTVDSIKVGRQGYALLIDEQAKLLAHGNPNDKGLIASGAAASPHEQTARRGVCAQNPPSTESAAVLQRAR